MLASLSSIPTRTSRQKFASSCRDTYESHRFIKVCFLLMRAWRWTSCCTSSAAHRPQTSTETIISRYALLRVLRSSSIGAGTIPFL